jgi:hypothetical protein
MVKLVRGYVAGIVRPVDDVQLPSAVGNASPSGMLGVLQEFKPISDKKASSDGVKAAKLRNVLLRPANGPNKTSERSNSIEETTGNNKLRALGIVESCKV